jgi:hypothetical protein
MHRGFVPFWRKSLESQAFYSAELWQLWCYILLKARTEPGWVSLDMGRASTEVYLKEGQMIFGRNSVAKILKQHPESLRKRMQKLITMQNCTMQSTNHYSIVTVVNWDRYATLEKESTKQCTSRVPAEYQPSTTKNHEEPCRNHEEPSNNMVPEGTDPKSNPPNCPHQDIVKLYHELLPELPGIVKWTESRKKALAARWREDKERQTLDWWHRYFEMVRGQDFLMGRNGKGWSADLEWLIQSRNMPKVLEGKYLQRDKQHTGSILDNISMENYRVVSDAD